MAGMHCDVSGSGLGQRTGKYVVAGRVWCTCCLSPREDQSLQSAVSCSVVVLIRLDQCSHPHFWTLVEFRPVGPDMENNDTAF